LFSEGLRFEHGEVVPKDIQKAIELFERASEKGNADAMYTLGVLYEKGEDVPKDINQAIKWYRRASEKGNRDAQYVVGLIDWDGTGLLTHKELERASELGNGDAMYALGLIYEKGDGVSKDIKKAVELFRNASEKGNRNAQCVVRLIDWDGRGQLELRELERASELGNAFAMLNLGLLFAIGCGIPKDTKIAIKLLEHASELGNAEAMFHLGTLYEKGEDVPKDINEAIKWYRRASNNNHGESKKVVRLIDWDGRGQLKLRELERSSELGNCYAMFALGLLYEKGEGVPKDIKQAIAWYRRASEKGNDEAKRVLDRLL